MKQPAVYMLATGKRGTLYIGVTSNLVARTWQHREHAVDGFTKRYDIDTLVWYELHDTMDSAIQREKRLKKWNREWKLRLVEDGNPEWLDLWPDISGQDVDAGVGREDEERLDRQVSVKSGPPARE